jgi:hypothetical protein
MLQTTLCSLNSEEFQAMVLLAQFCQDLAFYKGKERSLHFLLHMYPLVGITQTRENLAYHVTPRSDVSETPDTLQKPAEFTHDTNLRRHTATLHRCLIPAS